MLYEETFLDSSDYQKFQVYRALKTIDGLSFTINDLSLLVHFSYQQAYKAFREILNDIEEVTGRDNKAANKRTMLPSDFPLTVDEYRLFLLERSVAFQFIDYLVQSPSAGIDRFCRERYISRSTLTRKLTPLRTILNDYDLSISFGQLAFVGSEQKIRGFLFIFYWLGFHGVRWPLISIDPKKLNAAYAKIPTRKKSPVAALQEVLFWGICQMRIGSGHTIKSWPEYDAIFQGVASMNTPVYTIENFPKLSTATLKSESQYFHYLQNRQLRFSTSRASWLELYANINSTDNPVTHYITRLSSYLDHFWRKDAPMRLDDDVVMMTNIARTVMSFYVLNGNYAKMTDFFDSKRALYPHSRLYAAIIAFNDSLPDTPEMAVFKTNSVPLTLNLGYMLTPYLQHFNWDQIVQCRVLLEHGDVNSYRVIKFLRNMSFINLMNESDAPETADLIVTTYDNADLFANSGNKNQHVITWHADAGESDYLDLYRIIKQTFLGKMGLSDFFAHGN